MCAPERRTGRLCRPDCQVTPGINQKILVKRPFHPYRGCSWQGRDCAFEALRPLTAGASQDDEARCGRLLPQHPSDTNVVVVAIPDGVRRKEFEAVKEILGYSPAELLGLPHGSFDKEMPQMAYLQSGCPDGCCVVVQQAPATGNARQIKWAEPYSSGASPCGPWVTPPLALRVEYLEIAP